MLSVKLEIDERVPNADKIMEKMFQLPFSAVGKVQSTDHSKCENNAVHSGSLLNVAGFWKEKCLSPVALPLTGPFLLD